MNFNKINKMNEYYSKSKRNHRLTSNKSPEMSSYKSQSNKNNYIQTEPNEETSNALDLESDKYVAEKYRMINDKDELLANFYDDMLSDVEETSKKDKPQSMPK